jgi:exopolysaccharide biosynthesis polyprenyl glycosylphosphotransferase
VSSPLGIGQPAPISEPTYSPLFPPRDAGPEDDGRTGSRRDRWETLYTAAVVLSDLVAITVAVLVGYRLGLGSWIPQFGDVAPGVGILAGTLMVAGMLVSRAWDPRILGQGTEEFSRVLRAVVISAVTLGMLGLAFQATAARPWVFGLMPMAGALAVLGRLVLRRRLHRLRSGGRCSLPVLAVGTIESVTDLIDRTRRDTARGWVVTGACTPTGAATAGSAELLGVPIRGDLDSVSDVVRTGEHRIVAVCPTPGWTSRRLHHLAWNLEDAAAELVVDPGLMEVAGPRLHVEPVDGLPLLRLTRPAFAGVPWIVKHAADKLGAVLGIMLVAPLFLVIAVGVKLDGGPVFFRQTRVGRHGREFSMLKFRSMVVDAEQRRDELDARNEAAGPLFKMRHDPRVTPFGSFLRRYSLDELPQLFNVLGGTMSLVGPRPPLPDEVRTFALDALRRLMVRPGLTGLWQISGRSDLSWEQSVRVDLRYVENWSLALDALILWRTVGAVVRRRGAY